MSRQRNTISRDRAYKIRSTNIEILNKFNYIEANEAVSKKDFIFRIKICRKEAKESCYWLKLIDTENIKDLEEFRSFLLAESTELTKIFGAILSKSL